MEGDWPEESWVAPARFAHAAPDTERSALEPLGTVRFHPPSLQSRARLNVDHDEHELALVRFKLEALPNSTRQLPRVRARDSCSPRSALGCHSA